MRLITRSHVHDLSFLLAAALASRATTLSLALGAGIWLAGAAFQIWSKSALRRTEVLSTSGPYAVCRHPFYLANAIFDLGLCVMSGNPWLLLFYPLLFWAGYGPTMRKEEAALSARYPEAYAEFRRTTPMVLPFSRRLWRDRHAELSWENLRVERQISRTARYGAFPLGVWLAARLWAASWTRADSLLSAVNLAILTSAATLGLIGLVLYSAYERREDSRWARMAATVVTRLVPLPRNSPTWLRILSGLAAVVIGLAALVYLLHRS